MHRLARPEGEIVREAGTIGRDRSKKAGPAKRDRPLGCVAISRMFAKTTYYLKWNRSIKSPMAGPLVGL